MTSLKAVPRFTAQLSGLSMHSAKPFTDKMEEGPSVWASATYMDDPAVVPGFQLGLGPALGIVAIWKVSQ